MLAGPLTTVAVALFTGAAISIAVAEQPARRALVPGPMLAQWRASGHRPALMQASSALTGGALGCLIAYHLADGRWLSAALLLPAHWPFAHPSSKPTHDALHRVTIAEAGPEAGRLVARWARRHAGRRALALAAVSACLWADH